MARGTRLPPTKSYTGDANGTMPKFGQSHAPQDHPEDARCRFAQAIAVGPETEPGESHQHGTQSEDVIRFYDCHRLTNRQCGSFGCLYATLIAPPCTPMLPMPHQKSTGCRLSVGCHLTPGAATESQAADCRRHRPAPVIPSLGPLGRRLAPAPPVAAGDTAQKFVAGRVIQGEQLRHDALGQRIRRPA